MSSNNEEVANTPFWKRLEEAKPYVNHVDGEFYATENDIEFYDGRMQLNIGETTNGVLFLLGEEGEDNPIGMVLNKNQCIELKKMLERIHII